MLRLHHSIYKQQEQELVETIRLENSIAPQSRASCSTKGDEFKSAMNCKRHLQAKNLLLLYIGDYLSISQFAVKVIHSEYPVPKYTSISF